METLDKSKEVFKSVQDLVVQPEFNEGQKSFFEMYHSKFEDVDENKLEYTEINEIYLEIVDKLIEAKLKEAYGHTDKEIEGFIGDFKNHMKAFEDIDKDTVDILYNLVDFLKFKKAMVTYGQGVVTTTPTNEELSGQEAIGKAGTDKDHGYADFLETLKEPVGGNTPWKLKMDAKDWVDGRKIWVWQKKQEGQAADMVRCKAQFKGITPEDVIDHFMNPPPEAMEGMEEEIIEKFVDTPTEKTMHTYLKYKMPMMSLRDSVNEVHVKTQADGNLYFIMRSIDRPDRPKVDKIVRTFNFMRVMVKASKEDPSIVEYEECTCFNLNGYVPAFLMNMIIGSETQSQFVQLHESCLKKYKK